MLDVGKTLLSQVLFVRQVASRFLYSRKGAASVSLKNFTWRAYFLCCWEHLSKAQDNQRGLYFTITVSSFADFLSFNEHESFVTFSTPSMWCTLLPPVITNDSPSGITNASLFKDYTQSMYVLWTRLEQIALNSSFQSLQPKRKGLNLSSI